MCAVINVVLPIKLYLGVGSMKLEEEFIIPDVLYVEHSFFFFYFKSITFACHLKRKPGSMVLAGNLSMSMLSGWKASPFVAAVVGDQNVVHPVPD